MRGCPPAPRAASLLSTARRLLLAHTTSADERAACLHRHEALSATHLNYACTSDEGDDGVMQATLPPAADVPCHLLHGVPLGVKANIAVQDAPLTAASRALKGHVSALDADAVAGIRGHGAVPLLRLNMDEFGFGSFGTHSVYGPCANALDPSRVAGGSSSGSATAVAAGVVPAALGSDTGGSARLPASYQGIVGLRPTYGLVSRLGLVAYASSMDTIGVLARDAADACAVLEGAVTVRGDDSGGVDAAEIRCRVPPQTAALFCDGLAHAAKENLRPLENVRVAKLDPSVFAHSAAPATHLAMDRAADALSALGACVDNVGHDRLALAHGAAAVSAYYAVAMAEAASNLARYGGVPARYGAHSKQGSLGALLGDEAARRVLTGTALLGYGVAADYREVATSVRRAIAREYRSLFRGPDAAGTGAPLSPFCKDVAAALAPCADRLDAAFVNGDAPAAASAAVEGLARLLDSPVPSYHLLLTPTAPTAAPTFADVDSAMSAPDPSDRRSHIAFDADTFLAAPSLAGHPAVSVPAGLDADAGAMPVGVQLVADAGADVFLLGAAAALHARLSS